MQTDSSCIEHALKDSESAVLFSFKSKAFLGKKKASLRLGKEGSSWSNRFPLDTVAASGGVSCKNQVSIVNIIHKKMYYFIIILGWDRTTSLH